MIPALRAPHPHFPQLANPRETRFPPCSCTLAPEFPKIRAPAPVANPRQRTCLYEHNHPRTRRIRPETTAATLLIHTRPARRRAGRDCRRELRHLPQRPLHARQRMGHERLPARPRPRSRRQSRRPRRTHQAATASASAGSPAVAERAPRASRATQISAPAPRAPSSSATAGLHPGCAPTGRGSARSPRRSTPQKPARFSAAASPCSIPSSNAACGFGLPRDTSANSPVFVISGCGNAGVSAGASTARALPANPPPSVDAASAEVVRKNARRESGSCSEFGAMARDYEAGTPHLPPRIAPRLTHFAARATARKVKSEFSATEGEKASPGPDGQKQFTASTPTPKARLLAPSA